MGNGAVSSGHWALAKQGMGHWALVSCPLTTAHCPLLTAHCLLTILVHKLFDKIRINFALEKLGGIEDFLVEAEGGGDAGNRAFPQCPFHPANG